MARARATAGIGLIAIGLILFILGIGVIPLSGTGGPAFASTQGCLNANSQFQTVCQSQTTYFDGIVYNGNTNVPFAPATTSVSIQNGQILAGLFVSASHPNVASWGVTCNGSACPGAFLQTIQANTFYEIIVPTISLTPGAPYTVIFTATDSGGTTVTATGILLYYTATANIAWEEELLVTGQPSQTGYLPNGDYIACSGTGSAGSCSMPAGTISTSATLQMAVEVDTTSGPQISAVTFSCTQVGFTSGCPITNNLGNVAMGIKQSDGLTWLSPTFSLGSPGQWQWQATVNLGQSPLTLLSFVTPTAIAGAPWQSYINFAGTSYQAGCSTDSNCIIIYPVNALSDPQPIFFTLVAALGTTPLVTCTTQGGACPTVTFTLGSDSKTYTSNTAQLPKGNYSFSMTFSQSGQVVKAFSNVPVNVIHITSITSSTVSTSSCTTVLTSTSTLSTTVTYSSTSCGGGNPPPNLGTFPLWLIGLFSMGIGTVLLVTGRRGR